jgi:hypothetical protein
MSQDLVIQYDAQASITFVESMKDWITRGKQEFRTREQAESERKHPRKHLIRWKMRANQLATEACRLTLEDGPEFPEYRQEHT